MSCSCPQTTRKKVNEINEISGAEPTVLFQEEEITVKKPQEDIKIML